MLYVDDATVIKPGMLVEDRNDVIGLTVASHVPQQLGRPHWIVWDSRPSAYRKGVENSWHGWILRVHVAAGAE